MRVSKSKKEKKEIKGRKLLSLKRLILVGTKIILKFKIISAFFKSKYSHFTIIKINTFV